MCGPMKGDLRGRGSRFRSILAHTSHSNKLPPGRTSEKPDKAKSRSWVTLLGQQGTEA
jgi:hypothetical protein